MIPDVRLLGSDKRFEIEPNGSGRLTTITDPGGRIQGEITYNTFGQVASAIVPAAVNPTGQDAITTLTYDPVTGDLAKAEDNSGASPWVAGVWDTANHAIIPGTAYDALGDLLAFTVFPNSSNPATATKAFTTRFEYDATQTPRRIITPSGYVLEPQLTLGVPTGIKMYDPLGNTLVDAKWLRDSRGRVYKTRDNTGLLFGTQYDLASNPIAFIDGNGNPTTYTYGANNELKQIQWPGGKTASSLYDKAGRVQQVTDERNNQFAFTYDGASRLTGIVNVAEPTKNRVMEYDAAGRVKFMTAANGDSVVYQYSPLDKQLQSTTTTTAGYSYQISYTYAGNGTLTAMTSPVGTTSYLYDAAGRMKEVAAPFGIVESLTYDTLHRPVITRIYRNNVQKGTYFYNYGNTGQPGDTSQVPYLLRGVYSGDAQSWLTCYVMTRSYTGQVTRMNTAAWSAPAVVTDESYAYDGRGRLTNQQAYFRHTATGTAVTETASFAYDLSNNLLPAGWSANSDNQLTAAPARPMLNGATGLTYDAAGNLTQASGMTLAWNTGGDLQSVADTVKTVAYLYDVMGRRAVRLENNVAKTYYLYDGALLLAEADAATGQITHAYTWGPMGLIADQVPSDTGVPLGKGRIYLFKPDGNLDFLLDSVTGLVVWKQGRWGAYGQFLGTPGLATSTAPPTPFGYKGQIGAYTDKDTGLIRMGARDYAPSLGRFITRDPSGYAGGVNVYGYCVGDPVNFCDPDGEFTHILIGAGVGAVIGGGTEAFCAYMGGARGNELWVAAGRGAVKGAISGGLTAAFGPGVGACQSFAMAAGTGAASSMAENIVQQGYNVYDGKQDNFSWKSFAKDGAIGAATGGLMKWLGQLCFDGDTAVQVPSDKPVKVANAKSGAAVASTTKPIKAMKSGDKVFARDEVTGKTVVAKVKQVFKRTSDHLITIEFAAVKGGAVVERLKTTRQHPFFVDGKGWVPAGSLGIGNAIVTRAGPRLIVKSVKWARRTEGYTVYNFEVEALTGKEADGRNTHSYFVGKASGGAWVHNGRCTISTERWAHVFNRHKPNLTGSVGKSVFNRGEIITSLNGGS